MGTVGESEDGVNLREGDTLEAREEFQGEVKDLRFEDRNIKLAF